MQNYSQNKTLRSLLAERHQRGFSEIEVTTILCQILPQIQQLHNQNQAHLAISLDTIIQNNGHALLTATPTHQEANQINVQQDIYDLGIVSKSAQRNQTM